MSKEKSPQKKNKTVSAATAGASFAGGATLAPPPLQLRPATTKKEDQENSGQLTYEEILMLSSKMQAGQGSPEDVTNNLFFHRYPDKQRLNYQSPPVADEDMDKWFNLYEKVVKPNLEGVESNWSFLSKAKGNINVNDDSPISKGKDWLKEQGNEEYNKEVKNEYIHKDGKWEKQEKEEEKEKEKLSLKDRLSADAEIFSYGDKFHEKDKNHLYQSENKELTVGYVDSGWSVNGGLSLSGKDGPSASINAGVSAEAGILNYERKFPFSYGFDVLGEQNEVEAYGKVNLFVGAEAQASVKASIGELDEKIQQMQASKHGFHDSDSLKAGISGFAGAKLTLGLGANYNWIKKSPLEYSGKILQNFDTIKSDLETLVPGLRWILDKMPEEQVLAFLVNNVLAWGEPGKVSLAGVDAAAEGSVGAGAEASAAFGFKDGNLKFTTTASVTWGLGLGAKLNISLNPMEGMKFGLVVGNEVLGQSRAYLVEVVANNVIDFLTRKQQGLMSYASDLFFQDDMVRDAVKNNAHRLASTEEKITMINILLTGHTWNDDEIAILHILEYSKAKTKDFDIIIERVGEARLQRKINYKENKTLNKLLNQ